MVLVNPVVVVRPINAPSDFERTSKKGSTLGFRNDRQALPNAGRVIIGLIMNSMQGEHMTGRWYRGSRGLLVFQVAILAMAVTPLFWDTDSTWRLPFWAAVLALEVVLLWDVRRQRSRRNEETKI